MYFNLEHFSGGQEGGGRIGDILASRRIICVLCAGLKNSQI
jgi:hypothetical protein